MPELVTQAEFARMRGVSRGAVTNWKNAGLLVFQAEKVDVSASETLLAMNLDPVRGAPPTNGAAQRRTKKALAEKKIKFAPPANPRWELQQAQTEGQVLKNLKSAGELVPLIEAERRLMEVGRMVLDRMTASFRANAERLAQEKDRRQIVMIGAEMVAQVCSEIADSFDKIENEEE